MVIVLRQRALTDLALAGRLPHSSRYDGDSLPNEADTGDKLSLVDQYVGLLLAIYIDCGLLEVSATLIGRRR